MSPGSCGTACTQSCVSAPSFEEPLTLRSHIFMHVSLAVSSLSTISIF